MGQIFYRTIEIWVIEQLYGTNLLKEQQDLGFKRFNAQIPNPVT